MKLKPAFAKIGVACFSFGLMAGYVYWRAGGRVFFAAEASAAAPSKAVLLPSSKSGAIVPSGPTAAADVALKPSLMYSSKSLSPAIPAAAFPQPAASAANGAGSARDQTSSARSWTTPMRPTWPSGVQWWPGRSAASPTLVAPARGGKSPVASSSRTAIPPSSSTSSSAGPQKPPSIFFSGSKSGAIFTPATGPSGPSQTQTAQPASQKPRKP
ncbi:MAG TPA: hypothetical protein VFE24_10650 [Pirellulales bacterium]|nr:hypothetical protein [Pirellulales bacterium]